MNNRRLRVGLVGTGYAAKKRAEAFQASEYSDLIAVTGSNAENTANFCQTYNVKSVDSWQDLINNFDLDLICVSNKNKDHGLIVRNALQANRHVVVEYPLALNPSEAEELIQLAKTKNKLLHVEHIEILGGLHQAIRKNLSLIGDPFLANYTTIAAKNPAPRRWNYSYEEYGFPLVAALSRIHRFTDLFGKVSLVNCQARFWDSDESKYFSSCLCQAQLKFDNGLIGNITYGKGEVFSKRDRQGLHAAHDRSKSATFSDRIFEIYGDKGKLIFEGEKGFLIQSEGKTPLKVASRRGLFAKDTNLVLEHLIHNKPLYINVDSSLYALKIANAARVSVISHQSSVIS